MTAVTAKLSNRQRAVVCVDCAATGPAHDVARVAAALAVTEGWWRMRHFEFVCPDCRPPTAATAADTFENEWGEPYRWDDQTALLMGCALLDRHYSTGGYRTSVHDAAFCATAFIMLGMSPRGYMTRLIPDLTHPDDPWGSTRPLPFNEVWAWILSPHGADFTDLLLWRSGSFLAGWDPDRWPPLVPCTGWLRTRTGAVAVTAVTSHEHGHPGFGGGVLAVHVTGTTLPLTATLEPRFADAPFAAGGPTAVRHVAALHALTRNLRALTALNMVLDDLYETLIDWTPPRPGWLTAEAHPAPTEPFSFTEPTICPEEPCTSPT